MTNPLSSRLTRRMAIAAGTIALQVTLVHAQPGNDVCVDAVTLSLNTPAQGDTSGAGFEMNIGFSGCAIAASGEPLMDVWYRFVPAADGVFEITVQGQGGTGAGIVIPQDGCPEPAFVHPVRLCNLADSGGNVLSRLRARAGELVVFSVATPSVSAGAFSVSVREATGFPAAPLNDECDAAAMLDGGVSTPGTLIGAGLSGADGGASCGGIDFSAPPGGVWYQFQAESSAVYRFEVLAEADVQAVLSLHPSCPFNGFLIEHACTTADAGGTAVIDRLVRADETVVIRVSQQPGAIERGFTISATVLVGAPGNDDCSGAIPLTLGSPTQGSNLAASGASIFDSPFACGSSAPGGAGADDVFYSFTPAITGAYEVSTCSAGMVRSMNTVVSVHAGCPASATNVIACNDNQPLVFPSTFCAERDPITERQSRLPGVQMTAGFTYIIRVAGHGVLDPNDFTTIIGGEQGSFFVQVDVDTPRANPPTNDECESAVSLAAGDLVAGSTVYATGVAWPCGGFFAGSPSDTWFQFTSTATERRTYEFSAVPVLGGDAASPSVALYGVCGGEAIACGVQNRTIAAAVNGGESVLIRVSNDSGPMDFTLGASLGVPTPADGSCDAPTSVTVGSTTFSSTLAMPSTAGAEPCGSTTTRPRWFRFTPSVDGFYRMTLRDAQSADGEPLSMTMSLLESCGQPAWHCQSVINPDGSVTATVRLSGGVPVLMEVGMTSHAAGTFTLEVSERLTPPAAPPNDLCANAQVLSLDEGVFFSEDVLMASATVDLGGDVMDCFGGIGTGAGVWYRFTAPQTGKLFSYANVISGDSVQGPIIAIFTGDCGSLQLQECPGDGIAPQLVTAGRTYLVLVVFPAHVSPGLETEVQVRLAIAGTPLNDECARARRLTHLPIQVETNTFGALEDPQPSSCAVIFDSISMPNTVWYSITPRTTGVLTVTVDAAIAPNTFYDFFADSFVSIYSGNCTSRVEISCDCPFCNPLGPGTSVFDTQAPLQAGQSYLIAIGSRDLATHQGGPHGVTFEFDGEVCAADFNGVGSVSVQDIFDFLAAWFAALPDADVNGTGTVTVQDIFDFLAAWFAGC